MIHSVALFYQSQTQAIEEAVEEAARILYEEGFAVFTLPSAGAFVSHDLVRMIDCERLFSECDLVVCFGGDGTLLSAARLASAAGTPILGVNLGHIGFLSALERSDLEALRELNGDRFAIEERMMLNVNCDGAEFHALNDACVVNESALGVLSFDVCVSDTLIGRYRADGLIVASPTGSTAYSLSAGGSIVDPRVSCICVTPICAHSLLRTRALIEPPQETITIQKIRGKDRAVLCVDGETKLELTGESTVTIRKSERVTRLLRLKTRDFCKVLYQKLNERDEL